MRPCIMGKLCRINNVIKVFYSSYCTKYVFFAYFQRVTFTDNRYEFAIALNKPAFSWILNWFSSLYPGMPPSMQTLISSGLLPLIDVVVSMVYIVYSALCAPFVASLLYTSESAKSYTSILLYSILYAWCFAIVHIFTQKGIDIVITKY